jgi:hypothetical protein
MKLFFRLSLLLLPVILFFTQCKKTNPDAPTPSQVIIISPQSLTIQKSLAVGYRINFMVNDVKIDSSNLNWSSADARIATVNSQGIVHGLAAGQTIITGHLLNSNATATCKITVTDTNGYKFRLTLKDKGTSSFTISNPGAYLSARAITRRKARNIAIDDLDLPISSDYIKAIQNVGGVIVAQSKWLKTVCVYCNDELLADEYKKLPFVTEVVKVWTGKRVGVVKAAGSMNPIVKTILSSSTAIRDSAYYGGSWRNISISNGQVLHQKGFEGAGIDIADIDAGFIGLNANTTFKNTNIKGAKSFVYENADPYSIENHGVWVTSSMGVDKPGYYVGTAPAASYWLLRTEDQSSEFAVEEDYWVSAIEYADSAGVDVVNTSLTYTYHDGDVDSHKFVDMDGKTAVATRGANIAADKGILIVCSAGNDGSWVGTPADSPNVLTVGSINRTRNSDYFTSFGITVDGRIKPDVVALGGGATVIDIDGNYSLRSGTSYSSPIICGLVACLWQAYPKLSNKDLLNIMRKSGDRYNNPIIPYGYGNVDMQKAMILAKMVSDAK